jgi:hypothetical protein
MKTTSKPRVVVTLPELAGELGADVTQLLYRIRIGQIPRGRQIDRTCVYTLDQAQQIADWWKARQKLEFDR